jgi:hypothetical protein
LTVMCLPLSAAAAAAAPAAAVSSSDVTAPKIPYGPRQESAHTTFGVHLRYPHLLHVHLCAALDIFFSLFAQTCSGTGMRSVCRYPQRNCCRKRAASTAACIR